MTAAKLDALIAETIESLSPAPLTFWQELRATFAWSR